MNNPSLFIGSYMLLWFLVIAEGVAILLIFRQFGLMYLTTREGVEGDGITPGNQAPDFTLPTRGGGHTTLSEVLQRKQGAIIVFGTPHCKPCHHLLPELHRFAEQFEKEVATLFISQGDMQENRFFAGIFGDSATLLFCENEELALRYKTRVTPFAFAVDQRQVVRAKGLVNSYEQLIGMVESLLAKSADETKDGKGIPINRPHQIIKEA